MGNYSIDLQWGAKLEDQKPHMKVNDLITTLRNMNISNILDEEYMALYNGSMALDALTRLTILLLDPLHYRPKEMLNSMIIHIQHFQLPAGSGNP